MKNVFFCTKCNKWASNFSLINITLKIIAYVNHKKIIHYFAKNLTPRTNFNQRLQTYLSPELRTFPYIEKT